MHLVQILLPVYDNDGNELPQLAFRRVSSDLAHRFGGVTSFTRAPAEGVWNQPTTERPTHDDIVVVEVMVRELDRAWWATYRKELEHRFKQDEVIIRAQAMEQL